MVSSWVNAAGLPWARCRRISAGWPSIPGSLPSWRPCQGEKWLFNLLYAGPDSGRARKIRQLSLRITDVCNLRCHTCGQWGEQGFLHGKNLRELKQNEVSPERYRQVLDDLAAHGHRPFLYLWGGEPMLYEGTVDLIEHATALGMPCSIATNGTRVAAAAERLVGAPMWLMQFSVDGPDAALHNRARPGVGGADNFADIQAALAAVHQARRDQRQSLPLIVSLTTISRSNFRHLVDIYDAFRDKVDLFVFYLSWWIDAERVQAHEQDFSRRFGFGPCSRRAGWAAGGPTIILKWTGSCSRFWPGPQGPRTRRSP